MTELFGAQRHQAVQVVHSTRAFWIAEAGAWHAAQLGAAISSSVAFAGGSYTVSKNGDVYTSTAVIADTSRIVTRAFADSSSGGGGSDPVDEVATVATLSDDGKRVLLMDLVSDSSVDAVLESFSVSADTSSENLKSIYLAGQQLWWQTAGVSLPTGLQALNAGSTTDRTLPAGTSPQLEIGFKANASNTVNYTLVLNFTDGTSSSMYLAVAW